jgi:hypothetical protein
MPDEPRYMGGQAVVEGVVSERREAGISPIDKQSLPMGTRDAPSSERGLAARLRRSQERK